MIPIAARKIPTTGIRQVIRIPARKIPTEVGPTWGDRCEGLLGRRVRPCMRWFCLRETSRWPGS